MCSSEMKNLKKITGILFIYTVTVEEDSIDGEQRLGNQTTALRSFRFLQFLRLLRVDRDGGSWSTVKKV